MPEESDLEKLREWANRCTDAPVTINHLIDRIEAAETERDAYERFVGAVRDRIHSGPWPHGCKNKIKAACDQCTINEMISALEEEVGNES
jgi:hypothetical protein